MISDWEIANQITFNSRYACNDPRLISLHVLTIAKQLFSVALKSFAFWIYASSSTLNYCRSCMKHEGNITLIFTNINLIDETVDPIYDSYAEGKCLLKEKAASRAKIE